MATKEEKERTDFDVVIKKHVWRLIGMGTALGIAISVLFFSGYHYGSIPLFCGSCHSVENNYFSWRVSRHKQFACIECHLPRGNIAYTLAYKAYAGMRDVVGETARSYPYTIKLTKQARNIANVNCFRCHFSTIEDTRMVKDGGDCMKCHKFLVHGRPVAQGGSGIE